MFKKLFLIGLGATGALVVTNHVWSGSIHTAWKKARTVVERQISPEFELERIRNQIAKLTPDMNRNIEIIAEATVEVGSLNRKIEVVKTELDKRQGEILALSEKVQNGVHTVSLKSGGTNVKDKLARDMKSYKNCERDLANKQKLLEAKRESLESARRQLQIISASRQEFEVLAAEMEAELANIREAQCKSKFELDDSRQAKIKGAFENLRNRLDVEKAKAELTGQFSNNPGVEVSTPESTKDIVQEINDYFGKKDTAKRAD